MNNTQKLQLAMSYNSGLLKKALWDYDGKPIQRALPRTAVGPGALYDYSGKQIQGRGASLFNKARWMAGKHLGKLGGPKTKMLAAAAGGLGLGGLFGNSMGYGSGQNDGAMAAMHAFENNNKGFGGFLNHLMASVGAKSTPSMFGLDR